MRVCFDRVRFRDLESSVKFSFFSFISFSVILFWAYDFFHFNRLKQILIRFRKSGLIVEHMEICLTACVSTSSILYRTAAGKSCKFSFSIKYTELFYLYRMGLIIRSVVILLMVIVTTVSSILHIIYKEDFSKYIFSSSCAIKVSKHRHLYNPIRMNIPIYTCGRSSPDDVDDVSR